MMQSYDVSDNCLSQLQPLFRTHLGANKTFLLNTIQRGTFISFKHNKYQTLVRWYQNTKAQWNGFDIACSQQ